jgi:hypothetical protein
MQQICTELSYNLVDSVAYETNPEIGDNLLPPVAEKKEELL